MTAPFTTHRISIIEQVEQLLKRWGPLNTRQIADRLGTRPDSITASIAKREDLFIVLKQELGTSGRTVNVWSLKDAEIVNAVT